METYRSVTMIVEAAEAAALDAMLADAGFEGCVGQTFTRPCWAEDDPPILNSDGSVNMAASPAPVAYIASGAMHVDALALLPENVIQAPEPTPPAELPRGVASRASAKASKAKPPSPVSKPPKTDELRAKIPADKRPTEAKANKALAAVEVVHGENGHAALKRRGLVM